MPELKDRFEAAAAASKRLDRRPDNETLLRLYALYKQATSGDVTGSRPGMFDMVGAAKHDAWAGLKGVSRDEAMQAYVDLVNELTA
jgi:diazepam-binding inhibitor (GABA receptor modulator, acyl-CoA-binding protein)